MRTRANSWIRGVPGLPVLAVLAITLVVATTGCTRETAGVAAVTAGPGAPADSTDGPDGGSWASADGPESALVLPPEGYPAGYTARVLGPAEMAQVRLDIGAGAGAAEVDPADCADLGGLVATSVGGGAMTSGTRGRDILTAYVVRSERAREAFSTWDDAAERCSRFTVRDMGVTRTVTSGRRDLTVDADAAISVTFDSGAGTGGRDLRRVQEVRVARIDDVIVLVMALRFGADAVIDGPALDEAFERAVERARR